MGLYYRNIILGEMFNIHSFNRANETKWLHEFMCEHSKSYGILKGKVLYVYLYKEEDMYHCDIYFITMSNIIPKSIRFSSIDKQTLFDDLEGTLSVRKNFISFIVTSDYSLNSEIRGLNNRLGIKRKKPTNVEYITNKNRQNFLLK